jgi:AAA domain/CHC2 zinc finger
MKIGELTKDQFFRYYDVRLQGKMRQSGSGYMAHCPFHQDRHASLSVNTDKGVWHCHGPCNIGGGVLDFEKKFLGGDDREALARISELLGEKQLSMGSGSPERVYQYHDAYGRVIFEKLRYPGKKFTQRKVIDAKRGQYEYKLAGIVNKPLYHLPEVLTSDQVFIAEGEKDCDNLRSAFRVNGSPITATTNFDGAGKWRDEYGPYFAGKRVIICADNDEAGEKHAELVARCVHRYALGLRIIRFPDLPPKSDVSDFLAKHTPQDLMALAKAMPAWHPPERDHSYFMPANKFAATSRGLIQWLVKPLIQSGVNGIMISRPKGGKSLSVLDLAIALASGQQWLGFYVERVVTVGLVSREDYANATSWRLNRLCEGRGLHIDDIADKLYVNTKVQVPSLALDNDADLQELMRQIEARGIEFLILDVFRVLHGADENDNTQMQKIIDRINQIQSKTGVQILLIHHTNKNNAGTLTESSRGAGATAGWAEYVIGLSTTDDSGEFPIRQVEFELKAGNKPKPVSFQIVDAHLPTCEDHRDCNCPRVLTICDPAIKEEAHAPRRRATGAGK